MYGPEAVATAEVLRRALLIYRPDAVEEAALGTALSSRGRGCGGGGIWPPIVDRVLLRGRKGLA